MDHSVVDKPDQGNSYGQTRVQGSANVIQGNVETFILHDEKAADQRRKEALHAALEYSSRSVRVQQLSLPQIPVQSFDWIWSAQLPLRSWLRNVDAEPFFWICGKPGSGKSTLMNYLYRSAKTLNLLNEEYTSNSRDHRANPDPQPSRFVVLAFFFDFRARQSSANDLVGLVKSFIEALAQRDARLETDLAIENTRRSIAQADVGELINTLCDCVRRFNYRICALIDGLDEYEGSFTGLVNSLRQIQDRTQMKMLLASRSEPVFVSAFREVSQLHMQDHNSASISVYIDDTISRGQETLARVRAVFTTEMRDEIVQRAEGVIIWARLAIDELLQAAYHNISKDGIQQILEYLPSELEEMYDLSIARRPKQHQAEIAILLTLLQIYDGSASVPLLRGLWHFCHRYLPDRHEIGADLGLEDFLSRILTLLGSLVDHIKGSNNRSVLPEVRLVYESISTYVRRSESIRKLLPGSYLRDHSANDRLIFSCTVVEEATEGFSFRLSKATMERVTKPRQQGERESRLTILGDLATPREYKEWRPRETLLFNSLSFIRGAASLIGVDRATFDIIQPSCASHLMVVLSSSLILRYFDWELAEQHKVVDFCFAIALHMVDYCRLSLNDIPPLSACYWESILYATLQAANEHVSIHRPDAANEYLEIAAMIAPNVKVVSERVFKLCRAISEATILVGYDAYRTKYEDSVTRILQKIAHRPRSNNSQTSAHESYRRG